MAEDTATVLARIEQTVNFTLARILIMANDIATLQASLDATRAQVAAIAPNVQAEADAIAGLGPKLDAEATALGTLGPEVTQAVQLIKDLQTQLQNAGTAVPQTVFDTLGQVAAGLTGIGTAVSSSASALTAASSAIDASTTTIGQQVTALQAVLPPPPVGGAPISAPAK